MHARMPAGSDRTRPDPGKDSPDDDRRPSRARAHLCVTRPVFPECALTGYGFESKDWIGHVVELSLGTYIDKKDGQTKETIILKAISPRDGSNNGGPQRADPAKLPAPVQRTLKDELDDEIPPF